MCLKYFVYEHSELEILLTGGSWVQKNPLNFVLIWSMFLLLSAAQRKSYRANTSVQTQLSFSLFDF